jgi:hypothetical protein
MGGQASSKSIQNPHSLASRVTGLEDLAPDVLFLMLINAPNTQVLWGFIRASPRMYSVFRNQREHILSAVIAREIGPGVLYEAQSALWSSYFEPRGLAKPQAQEWIDIYQAGIGPGQTAPSLQSDSETIALWHQHRDVKFMTELYIRERLPIVNDTSSKANLHREYTVENISRVERSRLYRAFYRFITYGNLFYFDDKRNKKKPKKIRTDYVEAIDQSSMFLELFPAWQVEELSCVNDFIHDKILERWNRLEDYLYTSIAAEPAPWGFDKPPWWGRYDDEVFLQMKTSHGAWQDYLAVLSISELRIIFAANDDKLEQILRKHIPNRTHESLDRALDEEPTPSALLTPEFREHEQAVASGVMVDFQGDSLDKANQAWLWAHGFHLCDCYVQCRRDFPRGEGLRRFGYVFWDSTRLESSGLMQKEFVTYPASSREWSANILQSG